ncbi:MAG: homoserine kinase [Bacteriovoracaceae bacterium]|jgi:homoserine kinase
MREVTVFAPATCGNLCVGFDIMGLCYEGVGDKVKVTKIDEPIVRIESLSGGEGIPLDPKKNTAGIVLLELIKKEKLNFGFSLKIDKGIAIGSGMGGSAASAVGALVGANSFLDKPLSKEELLEYSLVGEKLSSGSAHADNAAPCLYGGAVLLSNNQVIKLPFPKEITLLLIHPHLTVKTSEARSVLKPHYFLREYITQSQNLSGFIVSCFKNDLDLMKKSFFDVLVEPSRSALTDGFDECKKVAITKDSIGHCLSGSGPSQLTLCRSEKQAKEILKEFESIYLQKNIGIDSYIGKVNNKGAEVL